jgi:hypothetical protein
MMVIPFTEVRITRSATWAQNLKAVLERGPGRVALGSAPQRATAKSS